MHHYFAKRSLRRRIIALAAAYAIAVSGLIASFGAAHAAADNAAQSDGVICHGIAGEQSAPLSAPDETKSKICIGSCCVGCLMLVAALPPPPANGAPLVQASRRHIAPPVIAGLAGQRETKSHRSRAPPQTA